MVNHERCCKENPDKQLKLFRKITIEKRLTTFRRNQQLHLHKIPVHSIHQCRFCKKQWLTTDGGCRLHELYCQSNPEHIPNSWKGQHHTQESKQKIAKSQQKAHSEGRNSSWIGRRKLSYAEQSWYNILVKEFGDNSFRNNFYVKECHYWLDFAWPEKMIYFEVDGRTHQTIEGKRRDIIRTERLSEFGWKLIGRCNWSEYQKMTYEDKQKFVQNIIQQVKQSYN